MAHALMKKMSCLLNKKTKGFTLIELLVVISIIGLLMSILLPSLGAVRAQGRGVVCKANIRQLAIANLGYASENDEHFVAAASDLWDTDGGLHRWHGVRESADEAFDAAKGPLASYLDNGQVKECPENVVFHKGRTWNESFEKGCGGYGYNMAYLGSTLWRSGIATIPEWQKCYAKTTKTTQVARSSETLMFADTAYLQNGNLIEYSFAEPRYWLLDGVPDLSATPVPTMHFRHSLKSNIAWADGHVGSLKIPDKYDSANSYLEASRNLLLGVAEPLDNSLFDLK